MHPITFHARPLTAPEREAGWGAVLVTADVTLNPVYLAHPSDVPTFADSPMALMLSSVYRRPVTVSAN